MFPGVAEPSIVLQLLEAEWVVDGQHAPPSTRIIRRCLIAVLFTEPFSQQ